MQAIPSSTESINELWSVQKASVAWGTIVLFILIIVGVIGLIISLESSALSPLQALPISTLIIYLCFTVIHEAGHRNIAQGIQWMEPVERTMGWLCAIPFIIIPFSLFARIHDYHHAHTNDPDRDPDFWVSSDSWIIASLKSFALPLHYICLGVSRFKEDPAFQKTQKSSVIYWCGTSALFTYLLYADLAQVILIAWVLPVVFASFVLAMLFDWIPHRPNIQQSRYRNTRIYIAPFANALTLGQSFHLIHHLNPRIPWYAYKGVFHRVRDELEQHDAPIETLSDKLLPGLFKSPSILSASNGIGAEKFTLTVKSIVKETSGAVCIRFDGEETKGFHFEAGQYLTLSKVIDGELCTRCYSICSTESSQQISVLAKCVPNGVMSYYLNHKLAVGDKLTVAGPFGNFTLSDKTADRAQRLVMIAGGSGITPVMSLLGSALESSQINPCIDLIYCNHSGDNIIFKRQIDEMSRRYHDRLTVHYVNSTGPASKNTTTGRLTPSIIKTLLSEVTEDTHSYICGPQGMSNIAKQTLIEVGIKAQHIHSEEFALATKEPRGQLFNVTIELAGGVKCTTQVAENQTVLEVAKQQGIKLPYACEAGQCGCCALMRVRGHEAYASEDAVVLLNEERKRGKTLACQCQPRSDMYLKILNH